MLRGQHRGVLAKKHSLFVSSNLLTCLEDSTQVFELNVFVFRQYNETLTRGSHIVIATAVTTHADQDARDSPGQSTSHVVSAGQAIHPFLPCRRVRVSSYPLSHHVAVKHTTRERMPHISCTSTSASTGKAAIHTVHQYVCSHRQGCNSNRAKICANEETDL